jgi:hypothetical protein
MSSRRTSTTTMQSFAGPDILLHKECLLSVTVERFGWYGWLSIFVSLSISPLVVQHET